MVGVVGAYGQLTQGTIRAILGPSFFGSENDSPGYLAESRYPRGHSEIQERKKERDTARPCDYPSFICPGSITGVTLSQAAPAYLITVYHLRAFQL